MTQKEPKYLVTGATGYLGSVLVKKLRETGHDVTSLALPGDDAGFVSRYSEVRRGDIRDRAALEREAAGFDTVIHLAGVVDVGTFNRGRMKSVNVGGTRNVAELCQRHNMKMLYCSSVHAIPCLPAPAVMTETSELKADKVKGSYGKTKAEATGIVLEMTKRGLDAMLAFPSGIIGPYEREMSNIGQLVSDVLCGRLKAYIDGRYNFVDVRDTANGIIGMVDHWKSGESYLLSGHEVSVREMLAVISSAGRRPEPRVKLPFWLVLCTSYASEFYYFLQRKKPLFSRYSLETLRSNCRFSNAKARADLGFSTRPAEESLSDMTRWIMTHFLEKKADRYRPRPFTE